MKQNVVFIHMSRDSNKIGLPRKEEGKGKEKVNREKKGKELTKKINM